MTAKIIDCIQGTETWFAARRGIPTASCFSQILAKGEGKTRRSYLYKLAAEIVTGEVTEGYRNADMDRGHAMEDDARRLYAFMADVDPKLVGFVRNGDAGCSPDSLIGDDGVLEIKTQRADLLIATIFADVFPSEHVAQTQGALWITEREWIDVAIFWPKMPLFVKRARRDVRYIAALSIAVRDFNTELAETVERIKRYGGAENMQEAVRASAAAG